MFLILVSLIKFHDFISGTGTILVKFLTILYGTYYAICVLFKILKSGNMERQLF